MTGRTIECGKNCTIRIDKVLDERTGEVKRHLHWSCRGDEGVCGEDGEESHGSSWEDAPAKVKECARRHGFNGQNAPNNEEYTETTPLPVVPLDPVPEIPIRVPPIRIPIRVPIFIP
jgi:hypothetical protein